MPEEIIAENTKNHKPFIHLHVHSEMSLLDGAARIVRGKKSPLINACKEKNFPAIAVTDHGVMYGVYTFQKFAQDNDIKPILGCELYICDNMHDKSNKVMYHILLLAKTDEGYKNLVKLDSLGFTEGFYYKPRIDFELLKKHSKGLICTTACIGGLIPQLLISGDYQKAKDEAIKLRDIFEPGDFYIELQDHGIKEEKLCNPLLVKIAREIGVKVVATNDAHYIEKEDAEMHDVLLCIQTRKTLDDPNRMKFDSDNFYLKTYEEMEELFGWCPEALQTPQEIADKCNARITKQDLMPPYTPDDGSSPQDYLTNMAYEGLKNRYEIITDEILQRTQYELDIIIRTNFAEYYLIVWDFINYAKQQHIPVGAGRGSGVGSIVAYAIGITNVDPLKYNLLFERFLNPERLSAPDFDIDFCVEGRGKVIDYVVEKYGSDKVCQILALGTMAAKNAIKDVARVYRYPLNEVNKLTKLIPNGKITLDDVLGKGDQTKIIPEVVKMYDEDAQLKKIIDLARKIEGMPRNCSKHAAGVVICKEVISDFVPLSRSGEDITTQFQKDEVEEVGMLKMDFLGLRTLTDIDKAIKYVKETTGDIVDFSKHDYNDPKVYELISSGDTDAIFQLESGGMKKFMKQLIPNSLEDVIAGVSLFRPGPMDSIGKYVETKHDPSKISYDHHSLEPILNMTYGCIVYQEQVMQIVQSLGGYTLGRADLLRRAMGKKKPDIMAKEKKIFINGCPAQPAVYNSDGSLKSAEVKAVDGAVNRGVPEDAAIKIFDDMTAFASYAFNKSHATAYAYISYETAYLKLYYPVQFIVAVINNRITNQDEIAKYVEYLRSKNVEVFPPNINKSEVYFSCESKGARYGLMGIKNVGEAAISAVIEERKQNGEFKNLHDFLGRVSAYNVNKRLIESLIKAGALDCFGETRATLLANYETVALQKNYDKNMKKSGQFSMFDIFEDVMPQEPLNQIPEMEKTILLAFEKEVLNIYLSGHPLDDYRNEINAESFNLSMIKAVLDEETDNSEAETDSEEIEQSDDVAQIIKEYDGKKIKLCGIITDIRIRVTKSNKSMAILTVEDLYDKLPVVLFPNQYEKFKSNLEKDALICVNGELQLKGESQIVADKIVKWVHNSPSEIQNTKDNVVENKTLYLKVETQEHFEKVSEILDMYLGDDICKIKFGGKLFKFPRTVCADKEILIWELKSLIGEENCVIKDC